MEGRPVGDSLPEAGVEQRVARPADVRGASLAGLVEWFWRGAALRAARAHAASARGRSLESRARVAAQVAAATLDPKERSADGDATFLACALYREAALWALRASSRDPTAADPRSLFEAADAELLRRAASDDAALEALRRWLVEGSAEAFAELALDEQARAAEGLRALSAVVLQRLDGPQRCIDALWLERLTRCGAVLAAVLLGVVLAVVSERLGPDLARGRPWRASSVWGQACRSPEQGCEESPYYFFHTRTEANPWVEIDLGGRVTFTKVHVDNREDCCYERAVPLVLEVSDDRTRWTTLASRKQVFHGWTAELAPTTARFVRLRVEGNGPLHLQAVRVSP